MECLYALIAQQLIDLWEFMSPSSDQLS